MTYQKVTGSLMANSHPGSYCGQDAYNDMFVTEQRNGILDAGDRNIQGIEQGICSETERLQGRNRFDYRGGNTLETVVRRLTPLECERLQNFPDGWTLIGEPEQVEVKDYKRTYDEDGNEVGKEFIGTHMETEYFYTDENGKRKKSSDSARYKALGNSIALPFWFYLLRRISAQYERPATLGSLFSGIGGFDLCWCRCNGSDSVLWSSEIEEFPIAVMKKHFGDEEAGIKGDVKDYL